MTSILTPNNGVDTDGDGDVTDDPNDEDDGDGAEVTPAAQLIDLELDKSVDNPTPNVGDAVTFTIVVSNQGANTATGVVVTDQLPGGYTFTGFSTSQGTYSSIAGIWAVGILPAGSSATLTITAIVNASGDYVNLAEVTSADQDDVDSTPNNGVDTDGDGDVTDDPGDEDDGDGAEVTPAAQLIDLELDKSVDNPTPSVGDVVTFTVVITNQGATAATGVVVTDQLPSGYTFTGFTTTLGTYSSGAGLWTVGTLPAGSSASLTLTAIVNASGDYVNLAEVTSADQDDVDSTPGNGVDTDGDGDVTDDPGDEDDGDGAEVTPQAQLIDLELNKSVSDPAPSVGDEVTFTILVNNQGPNTATGVVVTDQLPSGYIFTGFTASQGTYNSAAGIWTVGTLAAGQTETLRLTAIVNASGDYLNLAEVTAADQDDVDSTPGNGVDTDGDGNVIDDTGDEDDGDGATVTPEAQLIDLELSKSVDNPTPSIGDAVTFTVIVVNQGPTTATGVVVTGSTAERLYLLRFCDQPGYL